MSSKLVKMEPPKKIIAPSSWPEKKLADVHVDALKFCQFACRYCSSNAGLHLRFGKATISTSVDAQIGERWDPHNAGQIVIAFENIVEELDRELDAMRRKPGRGKTLVYSQLTDGFSPVLLQTGTTRNILELLIKKTNYRIRVLTKNAIVGSPKWVRFFSRHIDRFVVGLSIGTLDNTFSRKMEHMTSRPVSRISALQKLQDAGVPTYGMLCPVFPQVLEEGELERLIDSIRPQRCEHVWAEPYNDRHNWRGVRAAYEEGSPMWNWFTQVYGDRDKRIWSQYAADLYTRIHAKAVSDSWSHKLRYLLYEKNVAAEHAAAFAGLNGVLLQNTSKDGPSKNPSIAAMQDMTVGK